MSSMSHASQCQTADPNLWVEGSQLHHDQPAPMMFRGAERLFHVSVTKNDTHIVVSSVRSI